MKIRKWIAVLICLALVLTFSAGCDAAADPAPEAPDTAVTEPAKEPVTGAAAVYMNGVIYTVEGANWQDEAAEAIAVDDEGTIVFVGSSADAQGFIGDNTEVVDLEGKVVFPGFIDGHCHTPGSALTELFEIYLFESITKEQTLADIAAFIEENPDFESYWGAGYSVSIGGDPRGPRKEWLDEICDDKPIILLSNDYHNNWMNSKAFEMCGITPDTPVPAGGSVPIDEKTGELWGSLTDAPSLITLEPEAYTEEQQLEAMAYYQEQMHGWGYTSVMCVAPHSIDFEILQKFDESGDLTLRLNLAGIMEPDMNIDTAIDETLAWKDAFEASGLIEVSTLKYFADGVVEGMTGYLSEPYDKAAGLDPDFRAEFYWVPEELKEYFAKTTFAGLQIHVHSIGDAATEETLNALEYAQGEYPDVDARNVITHLQLVKNADKARMAEMNIIGSTQPFWHLKEPDWFEYVDLIALGEERAWTEYPVKSLIDAGVMVTFSGDHPVSPINNPFWAIEVSVTRNLYDADFYEVDEIENMDDPTWLLNPDERISVKEAIEAYTINAAYQLFRENEVGSIAVGKKADLIIVDSDIFKLDPVDISSIEVLATIFNGDIVFGRV